MTSLLKATALCAALVAPMAFPATASAGRTDSVIRSAPEAAYQMRKTVRHARVSTTMADEDWFAPRRRTLPKANRATRQTWQKPARIQQAARPKRVAHAHSQHAKIARRDAGTGLKRVAALVPPRVLSDETKPTGVVHSGVASYYWEPQRLASGGWFNPNDLTAAHKTLPFGTKVRVTHLGNGRSVDVMINDRGPYIAGRIIDLSKAAAGVIGMQEQGVARVKMEVLAR